MILKIKDESGNWIPVPTIKGEPGPQGEQGPAAKIIKTETDNGYQLEIQNNNEISQFLELFNGLTPFINNEGNWQIGEIDTGIKALGQNGKDGVDGKDGHSPIISINDNGNWEVDGVDLGVRAKGEQGQEGPAGADGPAGNDGISPIITTKQNDDGYEITITNSDGEVQTLMLTNGKDGVDGKDGAAGKDGSDANVTKENITAALKYEPVNPQDIYKKDEVYNKEEITQLIGSGGGTGEGGNIIQVQTDWNQKDNTLPSFLKNKPFGDNLPITERFSQAETPNPVSFESSDLGMVAYKTTDIILTQEQLMNGVSVTTNGVTENLLSGEMQTLGDVAVLITLPSGYVYATFVQAGKIVVNPEYDISVNVPEVGGYFVLPYGTPLPEGLTIELNYIGTKKIETKYLQLPTTNDFILQNDYFVEDYEEDDVFTMVFSNVEKAKELESKILLDEIFNLKYPVGLVNLNLNFVHNGLGQFYTTMSLTFNNDINLIQAYMEYRKKDGLYGLKMHTWHENKETSTNNSSTYGLRQTEQPTFKEIIEILKQSLEDRGLI